MEKLACGLATLMRRARKVHDLAVAVVGEGVHDSAAVRMVQVSLLLLFHSVAIEAPELAWISQRLLEAVHSSLALLCLTAAAVCLVASVPLEELRNPLSAEPSVAGLLASCLQPYFLSLFAPSPPCYFRLEPAIVVGSFGRGE